MVNITDEYMQDMLQKIKGYTLVLLKSGPDMDQPDVQKIIWEHGRRNFGLRAEGKIAIVGPTTIEADIAGLYIFNCSVEESRAIMEADPGVEAGVFTFEIYPIMSFPGDSLGQ